MTKQVLIPIDVTHAERTEMMMKQVSELAGGESTHFILLNVIPDIPPFVAIQLPETVLQTAATDAHAALKLLATTYAIDAKSTIRVVKGNPAREILQTAADENVDLIVIGSHQPGMTDYLIGSVASRVVRHANCSVLLVR